MAITKKEVEQISEAVEKKIGPYFTAIQKDFNKVYDWQEKVDGWRKDVSAKLASLERRIDHLAEIDTHHSKELRAIRQEMALIRRTRQADQTRIQELEERVSALELRAGVSWRQA